MVFKQETYTHTRRHTEGERYGGGERAFQKCEDRNARGPEIVLGVRRTLSTVHKGTCTMPATRYGSAMRVTIAVSRSRNSRPLIPLSDRHRHFEPVSDFVSRSLCNWCAITRPPSTEKQRKTGRERARHAPRHLVFSFFLSFFFLSTSTFVVYSFPRCSRPDISRILFDFCSRVQLNENGYAAVFHVRNTGRRWVGTREV